MHKYLRAVGFYSTYNRQAEKLLLKRMEEEFTFSSSYVDQNGEEQAEIEVSLLPDAGVILQGTLDNHQGFHRDFYYPYVRNEEITVAAPIEIDHKIDQDSYTCMCDDLRVGISLIFHMSNSFEFARDKKKLEDIEGCCLSAFSIKGKILIPLKKTEKEVEVTKTARSKNLELMEAARKGDEKAMESLSLQDMNNYAFINRRLEEDKEDLYSILDTLFMPIGVECDEYSILGTLIKVEELTNKWTEETVYRLTVECNDLQFPVMINSRDLLGVPEVGRRFRGDIWMQGCVKFKE